MYAGAVIGTRSDGEIYFFGVGGASQGRGGARESAVGIAVLLVPIEPHP